jgi:hypothetical protein
MRKPKHKRIKGTPEEAAYDLPKEVDFRKLIPVGFGLRALEAFELERRHTIDLDNDVAKVFPDSASVNNVLRAIIANIRGVSDGEGRAVNG